MAAWVASLPKERRRVYGSENNPNNAIWAPETAGLSPCLPKGMMPIGGKLGGS